MKPELKHQRHWEAPYDRPPMMHALKAYPTYFAAVENGVKTFEVRKFDRDFRYDDRLLLCEWDEGAKEYTGNQYLVRICYVLPGGGGLGIDPSYCVLGVEPVADEEQPPR